MAGRVIGDYTVTQQIGAGSFAVVWKAHHNQRPEFLLAIKEIATDKLPSPKLHESLRREIATLRRTNDHPNIIRLHDVFEGPNRIYLVLEYCAGGDLAAYIQRHGKVSEVLARHFMRQLGAGLQELRNNNLIHRDLKPQNLFLSTDDEHAVLKIGDFGFARMLMPQGMAETMCGSPLYMAPEILNNKRYDAKADLWSVGAILYQLVTGRPPYTGVNHFQLLSNIMRSEIRFPAEVLAELHPDCLDLCRKLLRRNPVERLAFEEFFTHPFMGEMRSIPAEIQVGASLVGGSKGKCHSCPLDVAQLGSAVGNLTVSSWDSPSTSRPVKTTTGRSLSTRMDDGAKLLHRGVEGSSVLDADRVSDYFTKVSFPVIGRAYQTSSYGRRRGDSTDTIDREYVLVTPPGSLAMSMEKDFDLDGTTGEGFPEKTNKSTAILGGLVSTSASLPLHSSSSELDGPSQHPPTRLSSLQRSARLITELATDKMNAGHRPESFSIQLVCLAIWKEALRVCQTWADTDPGSRSGGSANSADNHERSIASSRSRIEQEFALAFERAEFFSTYIDDASAELPDAMELIYQTALALGRGGAVDEFMGSMTNAASAYAKGAALFNFLVVEATALPIQPPLLLSNGDRHRLRRYADLLTAHQQQCITAAQKLTS